MRNNQGVSCSTDANDISWSLRSTHYENSSGVGVMNTNEQTLGYGNVQSDSKGGIAPAWCM